MIGLIGLGAYVPERVMTNDDWARHVDTSDEWITQRTGIKERRIVADDQGTADLAAAAARKAIADAGLAPGDIDEIIIATDTPETFSPDTAAYVQHMLGAREVPSYDLGGSGCAGFVLGLDIARTRAAADKRVLLVGVEVISRLMDWSDRSTCVLFGDAAGAAVIGPGPDAAEIVALTAGTDGSQTGILGLPYGGARNPFSMEVAEQNLHQRIQMNGREVFRNAVARMSQAASSVLDQAGVTPSDVALVIPHQANLRIIDAVRKAMDLPEEKVYVNLQQYGNTGSASVPLALAEARDAGRVAAGDLVLLTAFGAGFHWAAALLRF